MRHAAKVIAIGIGGLVLAVALSLGAFALAGRSVGEPATAVQLTTPSPTHGSKSDTHVRGATPTASPDEHGGATPASGGAGTPQPEDHGGGGHGSDD